MDTPWGALPVSDAHIHFFSHKFFSVLAEQKNVPLSAIEQLLGWKMPGDPRDLAGVWGEELDRHGISRAVLIASVPDDQDSVVTAVQRFPDRFYGYMMVNPTSSYAAEQVKRSLSSGHIRGLCLFPAMHCYSIQDARVQKLLDLTAAKTGTVAFVHCGVLSVGIRKKLGLPSLFDMRFSNPIDLHAVALRYPQIRFVVPNFGAGYFREALMLCDLCPNVYLDTSSSNSWMRYDESHLDLRAVFRRALDVAGPKRLLFGSDSSFFPRGWNAAVFDAQTKALYEIGITGEVAAAILHDNLQHLFS